MTSMGGGGQRITPKDLAMIDELQGLARSPQSRAMPAPIENRSMGVDNFGRPVMADPTQRPPDYTRPQGIGERLTGILGGIGRGVNEYLADDENRARLVMALNSMRFQPDAGLSSAMGRQLEQAQLIKLNRQQGNQTAIALRAEAKRIEGTDPGRAQRLNSAASYLENNPQADAKAALELLFDTSNFAPTISGVQVDPVTGQQYVVQTDRNTNQSVRVDIEGASQLTPAQEAELERQNEAILADIKFAQTVGQEAGAQATAIDQQIQKYAEIIILLDKPNGAKTGIIDQLLPPANAATAQLRATANALGIDIVNSATFGALSQSELQLALSTAFPQNLQEKDAIEFAKQKIAAQEKLRDELMKVARDLSAGTTPYSTFVQRFEFMPTFAPAGIDPSMWRRATRTEKQQMMDALERAQNQ